MIPNILENIFWVYMQFTNRWKNYCGITPKSKKQCGAFFIILPVLGFNMNSP